MKRFNTYLPALAVLALPAQALADQNELYDHMGYGMGYGGWFFGPLMMIVFFGLIVAAVIGAVRLFDGNKSTPVNRAQDILAERFASGEIDEAEYKKRKQAL